jgi:hypothetical protein
MATSPYRIVTAAEDMNLISQATALIHLEWPEFMLHDPVAQHFDECYERLGRYQFAFFDSVGAPLALGNSIPLAWSGDPHHLPDEGWDWAMCTGIDDLHHGRTPTVLCALQVVVFGENRGRGLSSKVIAHLKRIGRENGLSCMIAPVRPSRKAEHPHVPIEDYCHWATAEGLPYDPWLRVHARQGGRIVKPCRNSMRILATIAKWQAWTGMSLTNSGEHIIEGALVPVRIDRERDLGEYVEPNVWVYHPPHSRTDPT